jgi:hypothetical protein
MLDDMMLQQRSDEIEDKHDLMMDVNVLMVDHDDSDIDVVEIEHVQLITDHDDVEVIHCIEKQVMVDIENHGTLLGIDEIEDAHFMETDEIDEHLRTVTMHIIEQIDDGLYGETEVEDEMQHVQLNVEIMVDELGDVDDVLYMVTDEIDENLLNDIIVIGDVKVYDEMSDDDNTDLCL